MATCPLYPAHPFRGKAMPRSMSPYPDLERKTQANPEESRKAIEHLRADEKALEAEAAKVPRRLPITRLIQAKCRDCQPGVHEDCRYSVEAGEDETCPLYPWQPYHPNRQKKPISEERRRWQVAHISRINAARKDRIAEGAKTTRSPSPRVETPRPLVATQNEVDRPRCLIGTKQEALLAATTAARNESEETL